MRAFATAQAWHTWLERNHNRCDGLWVRFAKKASGIPSISYEEARDHALAFGWIDGLKHALDTTSYTVRFTPRRPRSKWSQINCRIAEQLIATGQMAPAGLAQVLAAKADGRWDSAYPGASTIAVPADFERALDAKPAAKQFFATLRGSSRFAILYRLHDAKRPDTRARRIATFVAMLAKGERL